MKIINIYGESGIGKTTFVQQAVNYIHQRGFFKKVEFFEMNDTNYSVFKAKIKQGYVSVEKMCESFKEDDILLIFDDCELLIESSQKFFEKIIYIINHTKRLKIILITTKMIKIPRLSEIVNKMNSFTIHPLKEKKDYFKLLKLYNPNKSDKDLDNAMRYFEDSRTPQKLIAFAQTLNSNKSKNMKISKKNNENFENLEIALNNLQKNDEKAYNFLLFLCQFPGGLYSFDLDFLKHHKYIEEDYDVLIKKLINFEETSENSKKNLSTSTILNVNRRATNIETDFELKLKNFMDEYNENENDLQFHNEINKKNKNFFWIKIIQMESGGFCIKPLNFLEDFFMKKRSNEFLEITWLSLQYLCDLTKATFDKIQMKRKYFEKFFEFCGIGKEGIWNDEITKMKLDEKSPLSKSKVFWTKSTNIEEEGLESNWEEELIKRHEVNFRRILKGDIFENLIKWIEKNKKSENDESKKWKLIYNLSILSKNITTIFKIINNSDIAEEFYRMSYNIVLICQKSFDDKRFREKLDIIELRLILIFIGLLQEKFFNVYELNILETKRVDKLQKIHQKITDIYQNYQDLEQRVKKSNNLEIKNKKNDEKILTEARTMCENAIKISKELNDIKEESSCNILLERINQKICKFYNNKIILMKAFPLVEHHGKEVKKIGSQVYIPTKFSTSLMNVIEKLKKRIFIKFEILTKDNLLNTLKDGCNILQLNFEIENDEFLIENINGELLRYSIIDLDKHLSNEEYLKINILIICCKNGRKIAELALKKNIPIVIYFEFNEIENNSVYDYLIDCCYDNFCLTFYDNYLNGNSIKTSFDHARGEMLNEIAIKTNLNSVVLFTNFFGTGPDFLINKNKTKEQIENLLFSDNYSEEQIPLSNLKGGHLPTNIEKSIKKTIVGRQEEIYKIMQHLKQRKCVNIYGKKGLGKTTLAELLANYACSRKIELFSDGVFYINLNNLKKSSLIDIMSSVFGQNFQSEIQKYFQDKRMLLIFDEFENLKTKKEPYIQYIFESINSCNIPYVAITKNSIKYLQEKEKKNDPVIKSEIFQMQIQIFALSKVEVDNFLDYFTLIKNQKICIPVERDQNKYQKIYEESKGNPEKIVKLIRNNSIDNNGFKKKFKLVKKKLSSSVKKAFSFGKDEDI